MNTKKTSPDGEIDDLIVLWRTDAIRGGERPEEFWDAQRMRIRARIESRSGRGQGSIWLSLATAAVFVFALLLMALEAGHSPKVPPRAAIDADQELLLSVERSLAAGTPQALEPVTLLVETRPNDHKDSISDKEQSHEN
jgi:hypothetical protein